jgi:hypothetical protein
MNFLSKDILHDDDHIENMSHKDIEIQTEKYDEKINKYMSKISQYIDTPEKCQALINSFDIIAQKNNFCQTHSSLNSGKKLGKYITKILGITMLTLSISAQADSFNSEIGNIQKNIQHTSNNFFKNNLFFKKIQSLLQVASSNKKNKKYIKNTTYHFTKNTTESLSQRIDTPKGFKRIEIHTQFENWLRNLPLKPSHAEIKTFNKKNPLIHQRYFMLNGGIVDMPILGKYQQCADAILRLRAEFLWSQGNFDLISFPVGNKKISYSHFSKKYGHSRKTFKKFLKKIYVNLGTASIKRDLKKVSINDIKIGDMNVQNKTGGVGHIFFILDIAKNENNKKKYLLGQGSTPAMDFHIIQPPFNLLSGPWLDMQELQQYLQTFSPHGSGVFRRF